MERPRVNHYVALDAWRGLCAVLVAIGHFKTSGYITDLAIFDRSYRFVDFFFVLSGFVIFHSSRGVLLGKPIKALPFLMRRVGRLWPLHVTMLIAFIGYEVIIYSVTAAGLPLGREAFSDKNQLSFIPANLAMVQAWGTLPSASWNVPAWSISAEFAAYLVFLICFSATVRHGLLLIVITGLVSVYLLLMAGGSALTNTYDYGVLRCLYGFCAGSFIYGIRGSLPQKLPHAGALEVVAAILTVGIVIYCPVAWGVIVVPVFATTVLIFSYDGGVISKLLALRSAQFIGRRSYSIYMTHVLILTVMLSLVAVANRMGLGFFSIGKVLGNTGVVSVSWAADLLIIIYVLIVLGVSNLTFNLIEEPCRRWSAAQAQGLTAPGRQKLAEKG